MADGSFKVDGLQELGKRLDLLSADMQKKIARAVTNAGAQVIKKRAKVLAPIAPEPYTIEGVLVQPGNIGKNVIVKKLPPSQTSLTSEHIVAVRGKRKDGYANRVGILNEFGTVKMAPQPFMRPAFDQGKAEATAAMVAKLKQRLEKAEKG